ncbi:MAG: antibiotic biosynthesis monooxygenase [Chloroflexi bacterium]|nr:antibiotic biosynthesis monooxygenase [Chloroflexota bacterium]
MIALSGKLYTRPGKKQKLLEFLKWNAQVARDEEPGTLRFDVYEDDEDDRVLYLYEAYVDDDAFKIHKSNPPYQKFNNGLRDECIESTEFPVKAWTQSATTNAE